MRPSNTTTTIVIQVAHTDDSSPAEDTVMKAFEMQVRPTTSLA